MDIQNFIQLANREHDALTEYCNSLSTLSHSLNSTMNTNSTVTDTTTFYRDIPPRRSKNEVEVSLRNHMQALKNLQTCHYEILESYHKIMNNGLKEPEHDNSIPRRRLVEHMELSKRVLTTCASSSSSGYGPLHENGLLKNLTGSSKDENWHEIRVVALVSLRASIQRLKRDFADDII
jgi:hypothetical protein